MKKYDINRSEKNVPDEVINRHKDFNNVLNQYQKIHSYKKATGPLYKDKKFLGLIILILVILLLLLFGDPEPVNKGNMQDDNQTEVPHNYSP